MNVNFLLNLVKNKWFWIGVVILVGIMLIPRSNYKGMMKYVGLVTESDVKATLDEVAQQRDIYQKTVEELQSKYQDLETNRLKLENDRVILQKKINSLTNQINLVKGKKPNEAPKEKEELAKVLTDLGYPARVVSCQ